MQPRVLGFRGDQDGNVRVGVFPKREEILIRDAGFGCVALQDASACKAEVCQRDQWKV